MLAVRRLLESQGLDPQWTLMIVALFLVVPLAIWLLVRHRRFRRRVADSWRAFATRSGLTFSLDSTGLFPRLEGRIEGVQVRAQIRSGRLNQAFYEAFFAAPWPAGIELDSANPDIELPPQICTGDNQRDQGLLKRTRDFLHASGKTQRRVLAPGPTILGLPDEATETTLSTRLHDLAVFVQAVDKARAGE
jgi:hypothetical protein